MSLSRVFVVYVECFGSLIWLVFSVLSVNQVTSMLSFSFTCTMMKYVAESIAIVACHGLFMFAKALLALFCAVCVFVGVGEEPQGQHECELFSVDSGVFDMRVMSLFAYWTSSCVGESRVTSRIFEVSPDTHTYRHTFVIHSRSVHE